MKQHQVRASFFILGNTLTSEFSGYAEANKHTLVRMIKEGHIVASHSFDHPDLTELSPSRIVQQMKRTEDLMQAVIGVKPRFMRPPYGYVNHKVVSVLRSAGYFIVNWNQDTNDWKYQHDQREIIKFIEESVPSAKRSQEGPIILQHDTLQSAVKLAPKIIKLLQKKGYEFVTLDECLGHVPYKL